MTTGGDARNRSQNELQPGCGRVSDPRSARSPRRRRDAAAARRTEAAGGARATAPAREPRRLDRLLDRRSVGREPAAHGDDVAPELDFRASEAAWRRGPRHAGAW